MIAGFVCCTQGEVRFDKCLEESLSHPENCQFTYPILSGMVKDVSSHPKRDLALIYIRESVHRVGDPEESVERQLARCTRLCEDRGWRFLVFQEPPGHRSGKTEVGRPKWKELKEYVKRPGVVAVVVSRLDRASRSLEDFSNFLHFLADYGIELVSVKENFDTTSAMGKAFLRIILILLELESDVVSERATEMVNFKKSKGLTWGTIPYGYDRKKNVLSVSGAGVKKDKELLKDTEAIKLVLEGYGKGELSYHGAARKLNALGYRMRDRLGNRHLFTHKNIRVFVENAMLYAGYVPNKVGWVKGAHPALIDLELAKSIDANRVMRKRTAAGKRANRPYALSSYLYCSNCGGKMLGGGPVSGKYYYRHGAGGKYARNCQKGWSKVEISIVEDQVRKTIRALQIPKEAEPIVKNLAKARAEMSQNKEVAKALAQIRGFEEQLSRAKKLFVIGDYTEEEYQKEKETLGVFVKPKQTHLTM